MSRINIISQEFANKKIHKRGYSTNNIAAKRLHAEQYLNRQYELKQWIERMVGTKIVEEPYIQARNSKLEIERNQSLEERLMFGGDNFERRGSTSSSISTADGSLSDLGVSPSSSPVLTRLGKKGFGPLNSLAEESSNRNSSEELEAPGRRRSYTTHSKAKGVGSLRPIRRDEELKGWSLQKGLQNGVVLCQLMRRISPSTIPDIHMDIRMPFKIKENICIFIAAAEEIGVPRHRLFQVSDLYDNANFFKVVECLEELAGIAEDKGCVELLTSLHDSMKWTEEQIVCAEKELASTWYKPRTSRNVAQTRARNNSAFRSSLIQLSSTPVIRQKVAAVTRGKPEVEKAIIKIQALVRGRIARRLFNKRVSDEIYRQNVVKEILTTEEAYVSSLNILVKVFYEPLYTALKLGKPIITEKYIKAIFSDTIRVIQNYNTKFLTDLRPRVEKWSTSQRVGDIFLQFTSFLKVYTQYVKDFPMAQATFDKLKNKGKFAQFLARCRENPDTKKNELSQFIIIPVQRIPRYNLLLADLVKHTWPQHVDYEDLKKALKGMQEVAQYINERKRDAENINKIMELQSKFVGTFENLANPTRRFIREDTLALLKAGKQSNKFVYMFNDKVVITKKSMSRPGRQKVIITFDITQLEASHTDSKYNLSNAFTLVEDDGLVMVFVAPSKEIRDTWVVDFNKNKDEVIRQIRFQSDVAFKRSLQRAEVAKRYLADRYLSKLPQQQEPEKRKRPAVIKYDPKCAKPIVIDHESDTKSKEKSSPTRESLLKNISRRGSVMIHDDYSTESDHVSVPSNNSSSSSSSSSSSVERSKFLTLGRSSAGSSSSSWFSTFTFRSKGHKPVKDIFATTATTSTCNSAFASAMNSNSSTYSFSSWVVDE